VLITHLPQESWTQTVLRDSPEHEALRTRESAGPVKFGPWALGNYQLAEVIDALRQNTYVTGIAGQLDPTPTPPKPTPRPGAQPAAVRALTPEGLAYLRRVHNGSGS
jgi:hypothetical protein